MANFDVSSLAPIFVRHLAALPPARKKSAGGLSPKKNEKLQAFWVTGFIPTCSTLPSRSRSRPITPEICISALLAGLEAPKYD